MLWLVSHLVETGVFNKANFIFLIVGHTKNAADRRFDDPKRLCRKSDICTFDQILKLCNRFKFVSASPVQAGDFQDCHGVFNKFHRKCGALKVQHVFSSSADYINGVDGKGEPTIIVKTKHCDTDNETLHNLNKKHIANRKQALLNAFEAIQSLP